MYPEGISLPGTYISPAEIGLYYLQSRYYDAEVGRFINGDSSDVLHGINKPIDNNLFVYCNNDIVNEADYTGSLLISIIKKILIGVFKGFIGLLGTDFIEYLYKFLFVDSKAKFDVSNNSKYLKSITDSVALELLDLFGGANFTIQLFTIVGSYFTKLVNNKMSSADCTKLVLKLASLVIKTTLLKRLNSKQKKELNSLKKYRKKNSRNIKLKAQKRQIKIQFKKKGFKIQLKLDITEYVLENILNIIFDI